MKIEIKRFGALVGDSPGAHKVFGLVRKAAKVDIPVLITGETGTGKDLMAYEIHRRSSRRDYPYVAVNMGMLTQEMVSSELFGHVKGAFTGATEMKSGRFLEAEGGTLFLDEIGTMEEHTQIALLRVLEVHTFRPLGAKRDRKIDVRVIAATNEDLEEAVTLGQFREDLYHRLEVLRIDAPPLREISEDVPMLAAHFVEMVADEFSLNVQDISAAALDCLTRYSWPGNTRELKNVIAQSAVLADGPVIDVQHLPTRITSPSTKSFTVGDVVGGEETTAREPKPTPAQPVQSELEGREGIFIPLGASLEEIQKTYVLRVLAYCGNNKTKAAKILGVSRKTLYDRLDRWGLRR